MQPTFFKTKNMFRSWLRKHHKSEVELWVGFHRKDTGLPSITYIEALDQALCFGWIDGVRKKINDTSYTQRFTPRKKGSNWSSINIGKVKELEAAGQMQPAGLVAFAGRDAERTVSHENRRKAAKLSPAQIEQLKMNPKAWAFWNAQPPGYRWLAAWFVISGKQEATQQRRLEHLIITSTKGKRIEPMVSSSRPKHSSRKPKSDA